MRSIMAADPIQHEFDRVFEAIKEAYPDYSYFQQEARLNAFLSSQMSKFRHRIKNVSFNNTTEVNSQIYFCNIKANKFNYSANPTYTSGSKIRVKNIASDTPITYITTVGLY